MADTPTSVIWLQPERSMLFNWLQLQATADTPLSLILLQPLRLIRLKWQIFAPSRRFVVLTSEQPEAKATSPSSVIFIHLPISMAMRCTQHFASATILASVIPLQSYKQISDRLGQSCARDITSSSPMLQLRKLTSRNNDTSSPSNIIPFILGVNHLPSTTFRLSNLIPLVTSHLIDLLSWVNSFIEWWLVTFKLLNQVIRAAVFVAAISSWHIFFIPK